MTNHRVRPKREPFAIWYNNAKENPIIKSSFEAYNNALAQLFRNNTHLCRLAGRSEMAHLKEVYRLTGFRISEPYYSQLKSGKRGMASPYLLMMIAASWGYSLWEFLFTDLTGVSELREVA